MLIAKGGYTFLRPLLTHGMNIYQPYYVHRALLFARNTMTDKTEKSLHFQSLQTCEGWAGGGRLNECRQLSRYPMQNGLSLRRGNYMVPQ